MKPIEIHALHPTGFPVTFIVEAADPKLHALIRQLVNLGYRPAIAGDTWPRTPEGLPICPRHGEAMTQREKQGDTWYSHKVTDPTTGEVAYCRGYPHSSAPGYNFNLEPAPTPQPIHTNGKANGKANGHNSPLTNDDTTLDELNDMLYN